jgi:hypothetical protein
VIVKCQPFDFARFCEEIARRLPCQHPRAAPCKKTKAGTGVAYYRRQCPDCGAALSGQLKYTEVEAFLGTGGALGAWSEARYHDWITQRFTVAQAIKHKFGWDAAGFWRRYHAYLLSPEWRALRRRIMERDRYRCRECSQQEAEQVHHLTYDRAGHELDDDLISVCIPCHARLHPNRSFTSTG